MSTPAETAPTSPLSGGTTPARPTFQDVLRARTVISRYLARTPLLHPAALGQRLGADVYLKCENMQPIGAFKVRGGLFLMSRLAADGAAARGVVTASTGNHGQSIAYAARAFGVRAVIYAPENPNPVKVAAMRALGAEVVLHGRDFDEARVEAERRATAAGMRYIHAANEPALLAGVGTAYLEMLEEVPDLDYIFAPIGGGSGACGACLAAKAVNPRIRVIGVQSAAAPAVYLSWKEGRIMTTPTAATFAEGLATRSGYEVTLAVLRDLLDDFVLVSEEDLGRAVVLLLETTRQVAEGAGAAATAGALGLAGAIRGKKVGLMLSGGNLPLPVLADLISRYGS